MLSLEERGLPASYITLTLAKNCSQEELPAFRARFEERSCFWGEILSKFSASQAAEKTESRFNGTTQKAEAKKHANCSWIKTTHVYAKCSFQNRVATCILLGGNAPCHLLTIKLHRNQLIFISVQAYTAIVFQFPGRLPDTLKLLAIVSGGNRGCGGREDESARFRNVGLVQEASVDRKIPFFTFQCTLGSYSYTGKVIQMGFMKVRSMFQ